MSISKSIDGWRNWGTDPSRNYIEQPLSDSQCVEYRPWSSQWTVERVETSANRISELSQLQKESNLLSMPNQ